MGSQSDDAILRAIATVAGGGCLAVVVALGLIIGLVATVWKAWHG